MGESRAGRPPLHDPEREDPGASAQEEHRLLDVSVLEVLLPEPARQAVVRLAADVLGTLPAEQVPATLRAAARFAPAKRVRLAGGALAAALDTDPRFRSRVAEAAREAEPELSAALAAGRPPATANPVAMAALAYLDRSPGWKDVLRGSVTALSLAQQQVRAAAEDQALERLREQVDQLHRAHRDSAARARAELAAVQDERDAVRREVKDLAATARTAEVAARQSAQELTGMRQSRGHELASLQGENRRLRQRLAEAEDAAEALRRAGRNTRGAAETRVWLLVETLVAATSGLRRELAISAPDGRPADLFATSAAGEATLGVSMRGDDPALLDRLLALPLVHLLVDGYNVTMTGYGELPLQAQRERLLGGLGVLAAQTGAEVTCVFDGATRPPLLPAVPRGVRVLFSELGQTADELILRLVGVEPPGRVVVVVSTDREVADGSRAGGAHPVPSAVLLRRLARS